LPDCSGSILGVTKVSSCSSKLNCYCGGRTSRANERFVIAASRADFNGRTSEFHTNSVRISAFGTIFHHGHSRKVYWGGEALCTTIYARHINDSNDCLILTTNRFWRPIDSNGF
jgi:hypothetical protein